MFFSMVCFSYGTHDVGESELAAPQTAPPNHTARTNYCKNPDTLFQEGPTLFHLIRSQFCTGRH